jgi:benzoyl-CoA reductase/2-hydroxyglutaryl-CoA dehydratase subunit BcrC/BadD/HgdB
MEINFAQLSLNYWHNTMEGLKKFVEEEGNKDGKK